MKSKESVKVRMAVNLKKSRDKKVKKRSQSSKQTLDMAKKESSPPPPLVRYEEGEESDREEMKEKASASESLPPMSKKWTNRQRVLVFSSRGLQYRDRHLMEDLRSLLPHSKSESKIQRRESLFHINEMAEMKNCSKTLFFEGRVRRRETYLWMANVVKGPSAKFQLENVHTTAELKMTGNCLKNSRPLLSFHPDFAKKPHLKILKELFIQILGVPNHHPRSQPFFDHVFTFSLTSDGRIWFRNFAILDESDASLAEIGPRFTLNPIKVFEASFSGRTLWSNPDYVTPTAKRIIIKRAKAGKYRQNVENKAAREASKSGEENSTYNMDPLDNVFNTGDYEDTVNVDEENKHAQKLKQGTRRNAKKAEKRKLFKTKKNIH